MVNIFQKGVVLCTVVQLLFISKRVITKDLNLVAVEILSVNDQVATIVVAIVVVLVISRMVSIFERDDRFLAGIPPVDEVLIGFRGSGGLPMKEKLDITSTSGGILKVT